MADKISLDQIKTDNAIVLDNSAPDDSITPSVDDDLRSNQLDTSAHYGVNKFIIAPSGVPTSGEITVNNTFTLATSISIFKINNHLFDISGALALIDNGSVISLKDEDGNFGEFNVTGQTDNTTYFTYTVTANAANPSYNPTSKAGFISVTGGAGGGGGGGSIMSADDTMTANRSQDLDGFFQTWDDGTFVTTGVNHAKSGGNTSADSHTYSSANYSLGNTSTALDIDLSKGNYFRCTATDNFTLDFSNEPSSADLRGYILIVQDGTGSRVLTLGTDVISPAQITPLLTTTAGAADIVEFTYNLSLGKLIITGVINDVK